MTCSWRSRQTIATRGDTLSRMATSHPRAARVAVTMLAAGVMALGLTSCGQGTENGADTTDDPFVDYERSDSVEWTTQIPATQPPVVSGPPTTGTTRPPTAPTAAPVGTLCGYVPAVTGEQPVIVLNGPLDCATAMTVSQKYFDSIGQAQGQGLFLTVDGWACQWPIVDGRSRADSYYTCTAPDQVATVRIGE